MAKLRANPGFSKCLIETLEERRLLSVSALPISEKIDDRLNQLSIDIQSNKRNSDAGTLAHVDRSRRIQTRITAGGNPKYLAAQLVDLGVKVDFFDKPTKVVQAWIPANKVSKVARLSGVERLSYPDYAVVNAVTSAGDSILLADKVRAQFSALGIDGTGIKIGVLSDGANNTSSVSSELPTVTINPSHPGTGNEGTAMMEIVHDLAPGAQLYFSGVSSSTDMTQGITWLQSQGCKVIVDDLGFFGEAYFTDSTIAQAAANAVSQGVVYVSAAGNYSSNSHWQGLYSQGGSFTGFPGSRSGNYAQFAAGVDGNNVSIGSGKNVRIFLQWSDPWGTASNDYDVYLVNASSGSTLASGATTQNGNDYPYETISYTNSGGSTLNATIKIVKRNAAASRELEMFVLGASSLQYNTQEDAIVGQQAVSSVLTVAAANASSPDSIAYYSSRGGSTIYTDFANQVKTTRQSLDGTAIDGVQTAIGQSGIWPYNPFYGTSAAAPHAAAIAALMLQTNPSLTPAQVSTAMANTATDLTAYGVGYDTSSGAGRFNALDAVYSVFTPSTAPDLTSATDTGISDTDNVTKNATPTFTGTVPLGSYVRLFSDGTQVGAVQLASNASTYSLAPSAALSDGSHLITIRVSSGAGVALSNNSNASPSLAVNIDTIAPTVTDASFNYDTQTLNFKFSEVVNPAPNAAALTLNNLTTNSTTAVNSITASYDSVSNATGYTFPGYTGGVLPSGNYHAVLSPTLTDAAGNALAAYPGYDFFIFAGDANLDRVVDVSDLALLAARYGSTGTWTTGDFNGDGIVDVSDLALMAANYGSTLAPPTA